MSKIRFAIEFAVLLAIFAPSARAQTGTWSATTGGNWSNAANWASGTIANGAGNVANIRSDITAPATVTLDTNRTIGSLTFEDTGATGDSAWTLASSGGSILTFSATTPTITTTSNATISAQIAGSGLTLGGNGDLTLSGANTGITGNVTFGGINGIYLSNANALGSSTILFNSAKVLGGTSAGIAISNNITLNSSYFQGSNGLTLNGTLTVTGNRDWNTFAGNTATNQNGAVNLGANTLTVTGNATGGLNVGGVISGTGAIAKAGTSTLTLSGTNANTFSGGVAFNGGTIRVGLNDSALGTGILTVNSATVNTSQTNLLATANGGGARTLNNNVVINNNGTGTTTLNLDGGFADLTLSGNISGTGGVQTSSTGRVFFSGTNTYAGSTNVSGGTLALDYRTNNTNKLGNGVVTLSNGSSLRFIGNASTATTQTLSGGLTVNGGSIFLDTAAGQTLTVDATGASSTTGGLYVGTTGGGTARLRIAGTTANTARLATVVFNNVFGATDSNNFIVGSASSVVGASDLSTWTSGATQYTSGSSAFTNSVNAGVTIDGITFNEAAARTVTIGAGNTLTLNNGVIVAPNVVNNASSIAGGSLRTTSGGTLTLFNGNNQSSLNISSTIVDNAGSSLLKVGTGTVAIGTQATYAGGTTINGGVLDLTGGGGASGTIRGAVTVNTGGSLRLSTGDATGYNTGADRVGVINLVGGNLNVNTTANQTLGSAVINMTGGSITGVATSNLDFFGGASALNTLASATTSSVSGVKINLRQNNGVTLNVADGAAATDFSISSVISSATGFTNNNLTKTGAGTLSLSGANTYTGATNVNAGTLNLAGGGTFGNNGGNSGGGALNVNAGATVIASADHVLGPTRAITIDGGTLTVNANNYVNNLTLRNGALVTGAGTNFRTGFHGDATISVTGTSASTITGNLTMARDGTNDTLTLNVADVTGSTAADFTISGVMQDLGGFANTSVIKTGDGTLALNGTNTYTGATNVNAGTVRVGNLSAFGAANTAVSKVVVASGATVDFNGVIDATYGYTISGNGVGGNGALVNNGTAIGTGIKQASNIRLAANASIGGTGDWGLIATGLGSTQLDLAGFALTKLGSNTVTLVNTTTTAGNLTVAGGTLAFQSNAFNGAASSIVLNNTAGVNLNVGVNSSLGALSGGGTTGGNTIIGTGATLSVGALNTITTYAGLISGSGNLTKAGTGALTLSGTNTYTGATSVSGGTLQLGDGGSTGSLSTASTISVGPGATFSVNQSDLVTQGTDFSSSAISGAGGFTQAGTGTTVLTAANTYTGATSVNAGTLTVNGSLASSAVTVAPGATLNGDGGSIGTASGTVTVDGTLAGTNMFVSAVTVNGTHSVGNSPGLQSFNDLTYTNTAVFDWDLVANSIASPGTNFDQVLGTGTGALAFTGTPTSNLVFGGNVNWNNNFWSTNQSWTVFSGFTSLTGTPFSIASIGADSTNAPFGSGLTNGGSFAWNAVGGNLTLNYTAVAVPEPSSLLLCLAGGVGAYRLRRRRQQNIARTTNASFKSER